MERTAVEGRDRPVAVTLSSDRDTAAAPPPLARLIEEADWAATPVGPADAWPQSLKTALSICLESRFPILIWWGPELVMLYNDAYAPVIGAKHPRALGQRGAECFPEIWDIIGPMLAGVRERGDATWSSDQLLLLERNGFPEECYFTFSYSPIRDESGGIGGVFTAVAETTEHVIGERRLRILRELAAETGDARTAIEACTRAALALRQSVSVAFSLAYLFDGETARLVARSDVEAEAAAPATLSLRADAPGGWPIAAIAAGAESVLVEDVEALFGSGAAASGLSRRAIVLPLSPGTGEPLGALVLGLNDRRSLDDAYLSFLRLVARQVSAAVGDAQAHEQERLRADALAELDRAKTVFFTNISHELRTPLTLILSPLEDLLAHGGTDAGAREQLDLARRNALRLLRLVNTLLDFSRVESGRIDALFQPTDLAAVTADLTSSFRAAAEAAGLRLAVECPALGEAVYVDRDAWEKIVLNLLSNAFKFTFGGEIEVALREEGAAVVLTVRDTGAGIPPQELPHLFERFHRIAGTRGRSHEGTGIGLALVDELVRLHGGTVGVESTLGAGTTFSVRLPKGAAHLPADKLGDAAGTATRGLGAAPYVDEALRWLATDGFAQPEDEVLRDDVLRGTAAGAEAARILIVDDNADMRAYLARLLRRHWQVDVVGDGAEALAAVGEARPDLVLTDVMMPGVDGFQLLETLRRDGRTSTIPVVLLSARAGPESAIEGLEAGADDYLVKPFSARELIARVRANLELARLRRDVAQLEALAEERARAERVLAALPDGVVMVSDAGVVELWNAAAESLTGLKATEVLGAPAAEAVSGWSALTARLAAPGAPIVHPLTFGGKEVWLSVVAARYGASTVYGLRDITEAARLEQMRRDLVTTVSHELRTPVSSIYGAVTTLARTDVELSDETREQVAQVLRTETERLVRTVDDLVTVSAIDSGSFEPPVGGCDAAAVCARAVERARLARGDAIRLRTTLPSRRAGVSTPEAHVEQIVDALLDNAARYTPDGGEVELAVEPTPTTVHVRVRDTGIGIPPEHHAHIGEKFFRVDPQQQGGVAGVGLSLYICRQLLALAGGRLWFESSEGVGSTFHVELPRDAPSG